MQSLSLALILVVLSACSNSGEPSVEPSATGIVIESVSSGVSPTTTALSPSPTITIEQVAPNSSVVVLPTPTASDTRVPSEAALALLAVSDVHLERCRIYGDLNQVGLSGQGTASAPTPTPVSEGKPRSIEIVRAELQGFVRSELIGMMQIQPESKLPCYRC